MTDTTTQIELSLDAKAQGEGQAPRVTPEEIGLMLNLLRGQGWVTAAALRAQARFGEFYGVDQSVAWAERKIRAVASASGGQVLSYPGSPGYRLTLEATIEEVQTAINKLRHQSKEMDARALLLDRIYHGKVKV